MAIFVVKPYRHKPVSTDGLEKNLGGFAPQFFFSQKKILYRRKIRIVDGPKKQQKKILVKLEPKLVQIRSNICFECTA